MKFNKGKDIDCPICHERVLTYRSLTMMPYSAMCKKCNKLVTYDGLTKMTTISSKPIRQSSSGMRFY